jgi:hypothetical protein
LGDNVNPHHAGRTQDAFCEQFLAGHSDYLDGLLPPLTAARMSAHAEACASCGRYDRIVRKGLVLARELPDVPVSGTFELRLQHRLLHVQDADAAAARPPAAGIAATLGVAAAIGLLAWSPVMLDPAPARVADAAETALEAPAEAAPADWSGGMPLLVESTWFPVAFPEPPANRAAAVLATFPGPYSPLVVTPPAHRSVRTISSEHATID